MRPLLIVCATLLVSGTAASQIFECVDAKGNKEYAQFCSPGTVKSTPILRNAPEATESSSEAAPATPSPSLTDQEAAFRKRELERKEAEEKAAKENAAAEANQKTCELLRSRLRSLQDNQRIARINPNTGEPVVLDDDLRAAEVATTQKSIDSTCKP